MCIDKVGNIIKQCNNTYHRTTKNEACWYNNYKDPKCKLDAVYVIISKYENVFVIIKEVFVINKVKNTVPLTYLIKILNGEEIIGTFYKSELQKRNQEEFRIEKIN